MSVKIVTDLGHLMGLASRLGKARQSGAREVIRKAEAEHDAYRDLCLKSDEIMTGLTAGGLNEPFDGPAP